MKIRLLAEINASTLNKGKLETAGGKPGEVVVFEGIISDYRFPPDIITVNGLNAYKYGFNLHEGNETISIYRSATSHNIVIERPDQNKPAEVSSEH